MVVQVRKRYATLLSVTVAMAFLLLSVRELGERSLWIDELLSLDFADRDLVGVLRVAAADVHPPAYFVLLHYWLRVFGQSDIALRLPSAIFSALSLVLIYVLGEKLYGRRVAAVATCFAVASPFFLLFSHMARYYSMTLAVSLLSTLLLIMALEQKRPVYWLAYALACSLVLYTDYPAIAVIAAHGVYVAGRDLARRLAGSETGEEQRVVRRWLACMVAIFIAYLPWLFLAIERVAQGSQGRVSDYAGGLAGIGLKLGAFFYSFGVGETIFPWHPLAVPALVSVLAALVLGMVPRRDRSYSSLTPQGVSPARNGRTVTPSTPSSESSVVAGLSALCPILLGFSLVSTILITTVVVPVVTFLNLGSRTMFAFPYFALLVAAGLVRMGRWAWLAVAVIVAANVVSYASYASGSSFLNPIYTVPSKQIAADVGKLAVSGDVVISTVDSVFERYYDVTKAATAPHFLASNWDEAKAYIERNHVKRVWLLTLGLDTNRDAFPSETAGWLRERYTRTDLNGYAEQDPVYRSVKERLLKREAYRHKATLELFESK